MPLVQLESPGATAESVTLVTPQRGHAKPRRSSATLGRFWRQAFFGLIVCAGGVACRHSVPEGSGDPSPDATANTAHAASANPSQLEEEGCGPRSRCRGDLDCVAANPANPAEPTYCAKVVDLHELETNSERYANRLIALMDVWTLPGSGDCQYSKSRCRTPCRPGTMYLSPNPRFLPVARRIGLFEHLCHWKDSCTLLDCTLEPSRRYRILGRLSKPTLDAGLPSRTLTVLTVFPHLDATKPNGKSPAHP